MFLIVFLCSILFLGYCPAAFAEDPYIIPVGQNQVFTQCNYHETWFISDWIPGYPDPWSGTHSALSEGNEAYVSMQTNPGYSGRNFAATGVQFQWDLKGYNWEEIKKCPVKVTIELSYTIQAQYELDKHTTANAIVLIAGFFGSGGHGFWQPGVNCLDLVGNEKNNYGPNTATRVLTFTTKSDGSTLTLDNLFNKVFVTAHCQANSAPDSNGYCSSSAYVNIKSIKIEFIRKTYGLFIGIDYPSIQWKASLYGDQGAKLVMDNWAKLDNIKYFEYLPGTFSSGGIGPAVIKSKIINTFPPMMNPFDNFVFYFSGHGVIDPNNQKEYLLIGTGNSTNVEDIDSWVKLYKDELAIWLKALDDKGINIWVIMDACKSGGFWDGALENLKHVGLIASAAKGKDSVSDIFRHIGVFEIALAADLDAQSRGYNTWIDTNHDGMISFSELASRVTEGWCNTTFVRDYIDRPVFVRGLEDPVIFTLDMWNPSGAKSADFNGVFSGEPAQKKALPWLMLFLD